MSIPPQEFFVEKIAGDKASVYSLMPAGRDPHSFEISPKQMVTLTKANIYFLMGLEFEDVLVQKLEKLNTDLDIVDLRKGITLLKAPSALGASNASSQNRAEPSHEFDPHIWLSPTKAKIFSRTIAETFIALDPANKTFYESRLASLEKELDDLFQTTSRALNFATGKKFFIVHPFLGYYAEDFHLIQIPLEEEGKSPSIRQVQGFMDLMKEEKATMIFTQSALYTRHTQLIQKDTGAIPAEIDPLAENFMQNIKDITALMVKNFQTS